MHKLNQHYFVNTFVIPADRGTAQHVVHRRLFHAEVTYWDRFLQYKVEFTISELARLFTCYLRIVFYKRLSTALLCRRTLHSNINE